MLKRLCCAVCFLLCGFFPAAAQAVFKPALAILPFDNEVRTRKENEDIIAMRFMTEKVFAGTQRFIIISPQETEKIFAVNNIPPHEVYKETSIKKLKDAGVNFIVTADIDVFDKIYRLRLYFIDTERNITATSKLATFEKLGRTLQSRFPAFVEEFSSDPRILDAYSEIFVPHTPPMYAVGDTGPAGGVIFYVKPVRSQGWHYLEAAPVDFSEKYPWGFFDDSVWTFSGTALEVGEGRRNTASIIETERTEKYASAARVCTMLNYNGYSDWFLPSIEELDLLYQNLAKHGLGGFAELPYWSSSQSSESTAWFFNFSNGKQFLNGRKTDLLLVRAIRSF